MTTPWVGWLGFLVLATTVLVSSCQAIGAPLVPRAAVAVVDVPVAPAAR